MSVRNYSLLDDFILRLDRGIRVIHTHTREARRSNPASSVEEGELSPEQRQLSTRLMRVNHAGEVSAQALYEGQSMTARDPDVKQSMQQSAVEEIDHLRWCEERIQELDGHTSLIGPVWYLGSFMIGVVAGACGDKWSLGFIAETERQVVHHLQGHLERLPESDQRSRAILEQMVDDEGHHATVALESGGVELPERIRKIMKITSTIMTETAFWI